MYDETISIMVVFFWFNGGKTVRDSNEAEVLAITIREALRIFKSFIATQLIVEGHLENGITWIRDREKTNENAFCLQ